MSEYREALSKLCGSIERLRRKYSNGVIYIEDVDANVRVAMDAAKALLARGEPDKQGDLLRLLALRGYKIDEAEEIARLVFSSEPAAAEKAREPMHEGLPVDTRVVDTFTSKVGTIVSYHCRFEVWWDDGSKDMDVHCRQLKEFASPPAAKVEAEKARELFTRDEWTDDAGNVLWWRFPIVEPPYCGRLDDDHITCHELQDYYTHWTRIPLPSPPAATAPCEDCGGTGGVELSFDPYLALPCPSCNRDDCPPAATGETK